MTDIVKPAVDKRKRISAIWIIPILALVIGVWMVVDTKMSQGPVITISFENAEDLVANKTKVQYLNVAVGEVESVVLNEQKDGVLVTVQMDPRARSLLKSDSEFWVVRARVGLGNVSGLGTLLGGAYIELSPGESKDPSFSYVGLETPPLTPLGAPGVRLTLWSSKAGSVSTGDAVLFNGYRVGRIEATDFDETRKQVRYDVFIDAPYDSLVNTGVRFWNISGINFKASASGIDFRTGSMDTILLGGVAFGVPEGANRVVRLLTEPSSFCMTVLSRFRSVLMKIQLNTSFGLSSHYVGWYLELQLNIGEFKSARSSGS